MKEAFTHKSLLILGRGIGQVMFQNNALSGLLMLIGIFLNSWQMGLLAVSGNIISTSTGRISGYDRDDIKNGLYGFNGTLVGIAVGVFMHLTVNSLILMAIASCASTYIARFFNMQRNIDRTFRSFRMADNGNKKTLSPLQIRQKASHQPQQRHKGTYIINSLYTIFISHASQYSRSNTGNSKSETKEQPGNQPQLIG